MNLSYRYNFYRDWFFKWSTHCQASADETELNQTEGEIVVESLKELSLTMSSSNNTLASSIDDLPSTSDETKQQSHKSASEKTKRFLSEMGFYSEVSQGSSSITVDSMQNLKKKRKRKRKHADQIDRDNYASASTANKINKQEKAPADIINSQVLKKYWFQRYRLFSRFDEGIKLDHGMYILQHPNLPADTKL